VAHGDDVPDIGLLVAASLDHPQVTQAATANPADPVAPRRKPVSSLPHLLFARKIPLWRLLAIIAAAGGVLLATRPVSDPDIFWHIRLGDLIRQTGVPHREPWSYPILGNPWHPTAWLTDVLLSALHDVGGWRAIVAFKVVASAGILALLYRQVIPRARAEITAPVLVIALASVGVFFSERPQMLSFLLVLLVGPWAVRLATTGHWRAWPWVAITYLWCNVHGWWVLGPALLGLAAVSWVVQSRFSRSSVGTLTKAAGTALIAVLTTMATPVGPALTVQPLAVHAIAPEITEWQPTSLLGNAPLGYALLLLCLVVSWALVPPKQVGLLVFCVAAIGFSLIAVRNVAPVTLLLAPIVAQAAGAAFGPLLERRPQSLVPLWVGVAAAIGTAGLVTTAAFARPAVDPTIPWRILHQLDALPAPKHVVADFLVSGVITGEVPSASVAMDTRVDNYSLAYTHEYLAMLRMGPDWRQTFAKAHPDYVVLLNDSGLRAYLEHDRHWVVMTRDNGFVLLRPPQ
jgi:hypothetical protein